ncbi:hypothetical protein [Actinoplanes sp. NPDC026670]|uniref:hypothetical protein n=1 Tax=Actinoplanes sp. NPDC026670 TaxID=3154700 RepID=UPI0033C8F030
MAAEHEAGQDKAALVTAGHHLNSASVNKRPANELLRQARLRLPAPSGSGRPMSRRELAEAVNEYLWRTHGRRSAIDADYVGKLERGDYRWPQGLYREAFRVVLAVTADASLGFFVTRPMPSAAKPFDAPNVEAGSSAHTAVGDSGCDLKIDDPPYPGEDVIDVLGRIQKLNRAVDPMLVEYLQGNLRHTLAQYECLDHGSLNPVLVKQRLWIETLLDECGHPRQRKQLYMTAAATAGLLGYIAVGRGAFPLARAYCLEAFQLGEFADDTNLQAWACGLQSFCEYYAQDYREALRLAQYGLTFAQGGPQSVRLTINGAARAMGKLQDAEGVRRAVGEAYELMAQNDVPVGVPSSIALECYSAAQTAGNAATAYVALGLPEQVQSYVDLALPDIAKSSSPWSRSLVLIDLASSYVRSGSPDLDRAAEVATEALGVPGCRPIISVQQRVSELIRDASERWGECRQVESIRDAAAAMKAVL